MSIERHLKELGLTLPDPPKPAGNYVPWLICGNLMFLSGQFPIKNGQLLYTGRVGAELTEDQGYAAARLAALNVLAQIRTALGGFDRLRTLLRVEGHVASAHGWNRAPKVLMARPTSSLLCWANAVSTRAPRSLPRNYR